jgi:myosin heavy subunit
MDGQYGNVSFICTQTDDLEATETMRDHADVAAEEPGRWEKMTELSEGIANLEKQRNDKAQEEEDLKIELEEAKERLNEAKWELKEASKENEDDTDVDIDQLTELQSAVTEARKSQSGVLRKLEDCRRENKEPMKKYEAKCHKLQRQLKGICAVVRNKYSKTCLQDDFRSGLKELYRKDDDDDGEDLESSEQPTALPDDYNMDVFCISANDYLKLMGIKPSTDGPPNTFSKPRETQIPMLRSFVHETTSRYWYVHRVDSRDEQLMTVPH